MVPGQPECHTETLCLHVRRFIFWFIMNAKPAIVLRSDLKLQIVQLLNDLSAARVTSHGRHSVTSSPREAFRFIELLLLLNTRPCSHCFTEWVFARRLSIETGVWGSPFREAVACQVIFSVCYQPINGKHLMGRLLCECELYAYGLQERLP